MRYVRAEIELINTSDVSLFENKIIPKSKIRSLKVKALVDTGAGMMTINENIKNQLGLKVRGKRLAQLADGTIKELEIAGPLEVRFKDRFSVTNAMVLPGNQEVLLGAIPMEEMDVLVHPLKEKLIVNPEHPNGPQLSLK
jgi:clan AA aspartic protease